MMKTRTQHSECFVCSSEYMDRLAWKVTELGTLARIVDQFERMFVESCEKQCNSGVYELQYFLFDTLWTIKKKLER